MYKKYCCYILLTTVTTKTTVTITTTCITNIKWLFNENSALIWPASGLNPLNSELLAMGI